MSAAPARLRVQVRLQPRAAQNRIVGLRGDTIKVQVHAAPVGGAANAALVELFADILAVPRRCIHIVRGTTNRDKLIEIESADLALCRQRLHEALYARVDKARGGD